MANTMGRIVYVKITRSCKEAHQYVTFDSERIGEIWREQVDLVDTKGKPLKRWRWFALPNHLGTQPDTAKAFNYTTGFGSKDKAVDALECLLKALP